MLDERGPVKKAHAARIGNQRPQLALQSFVIG
jgi:hypothetical protein